MAYFCRNLVYMDSFYNILKSAHSGWAYIVVIMVTVATVNALIGFFRKSEFGNKDFSLSLIALIVTHIQLLLGIVLYFVTPYFDAWANGMGDVMANDILRFHLVEHVLTMIIAVVLITIGYSKHKKQRTSQGKFRRLAIFYPIAFILIMSRLPWNDWLGI